MSAARAQVLLEELLQLLAPAPRSEWMHQDSPDLPLPRRTYLRAARDGRFPARRDGKLVLARREDLDRYIANLPLRSARAARLVADVPLDAHRLADELRKPSSKARRK